MTAIESPQANAFARWEGRCLAPGQQVCTVRGPVAVDELAADGGFDALCFELATERYLMRPARARKAAAKRTVRLHTDRAKFQMTFDQPVMLQNGQYLIAAELTPGTQLRACSAKSEPGYLLTSRDHSKAMVDLDHLVAAECAVANWYPVPSIEDLGVMEVYEVEVAGPASDYESPERRPNILAWTAVPGGGFGIVVAAGSSSL